MGIELPNFRLGVRLQTKVRSPNHSATEGATIVFSVSAVCAQCEIDVRDVCVRCERSVCSVFGGCMGYVCSV